MSNLADNYRNEWIALKEDSDYEFGGAQSFVSTLLALPPEPRFSLEALLEDIQADAFSRGISIPNLDLVKFKQERLAREREPRANAPKVVATLADDFNDLLRDSCDKYADIVGHTKGLFLFRLVRGETSPTIPIFLCDQAALKHPKICSLDTREPRCRKEMLDTFIAAEEKDQTTAKTYLAVVVVTPSLKDTGELVDEIRKFENLFDRAELISPRLFPISGGDDYEIKTLADGIESVESVCGKVLNNRDLSAGDEAIIKKCFEGREMVLDYKFLKKGNTEAKVIEVRPHQGHSGEMARWVIKYAEGDSKDKLKEEKKHCKEHVEQHAINGYSAEFIETATHSAILYKYASSDGRRDSFPFAAIADDIFLDRKKTPHSPNDTLTQLFKCEVFEKWASPLRDEKKTVGDLYQHYLTKADVVITTAGNIDAEAAETLAANYQQIREYELDTKLKVCHGDLHTENFFKDEDNVYLIDFGWTKSLHSVIDHTTLEASLKFKHLPFFLGKDYVTGLERDYMLGIESFDSNFNLSPIDREPVRHVFALICAIREDAKKFMLDQNNPWEYLLSLYVISFRQILYPDLNQRYALASANMLGERIVKMSGQV